MTYTPVEQLPWMDDAECAHTDPELWFPERGGPAQAAIRICNNCPVRVQCLDYAMSEHLPFGIWGGATQRQIAQLRRKG